MLHLRSPQPPLALAGALALGLSLLAASDAHADEVASDLVVAEEPTLAPKPAPPPASVATAPITHTQALAPRTFRTERSFYGWQNIVVGHGSIVLASLIAGLGEGQDTATGGGLIGLGYLVGGPIIHAVHGDGTKSLVAAGILVGIPSTLAITGLVIDEACGDEASCNGNSWAFGLLAGVILAPIIDGVALGWEDVDVENEPADVTVLPFVTPRLSVADLAAGDLAAAERGAVVGVVGSF